VTGYCIKFKALEVDIGVLEDAIRAGLGAMN